MYNSFKEFMEQEVVPFLACYRRESYFKNSKNHNIFYHTYKIQNAKQAVVISHGFCEFIEKYEEVIYRFLKAGYSVYIMEHQGHGYSHRLVKDLDLVHIADYRNYVRDFVQFVEKIVRPQEQHINLFAHSMGGMIGTLAMQAHTGLFKKAVLSSPMYKVQISPIPEKFAYAIVTAACHAGLCKKLSIGQRHFIDRPTFASSSALCEERYLYFYNKRLENERYQTYGGSFGWVKEAFRGTKTVMKKTNIRKLDTKMLLFSADMESVVDIEAHKEFAQNAANLEYVYVKDSKHEIFNAGEEVREEYYRKIFEFFEGI